MDYPPFYIGQKVVAIKSGHADLKDVRVYLHKDQVYTVFALDQCEGCKTWRIAVAELPNHLALGKAICRKCNNTASVDTHYWLATAEAFVPLESTFESITYEKVMEIESPLICSN
jgi:microcystin-dependent protein